MKKALFILLTLCLCALTLVACDKGEQTADTVADTAAESTVDTTAETFAEATAETTDEAATEIATDVATEATTDAATEAATEAETQPYVMDTAVVDRVYTYIARRGFMAVAVNNEGKPLGINPVDSDDMVVQEDSENWCPLTTFTYAEDGKMTAIVIDGVEVAVTAWDALGRPTAVAENDKGISVVYDDQAGTLTVGYEERIWVFDGYCRCLKYEEDPTEISTMTFDADGNHAKAVFVGNDRYEYLITYENYTHLVTVDEYDTDGTDFIYNLKWTEQGLCAEITFTELDQAEGQTERVLQESLRTVFERDSEGRFAKIQEYYTNYEDEKPEEQLAYEEIYTYNEAGLLVKEEGRSYEGGAPWETVVKDMTYNDAGLLTYQTSTYYDGENNVDSYMTVENTYGDNGKPSRLVIINYNADHVKEKETIAELTWTSDTSGTRHEISIVYENGVEVSREEHDFGFDEVK